MADCDEGHFQVLDAEVVSVEDARIIYRRSGKERHLEEIKLYPLDRLSKKIGDHIIMHNILVLAEYKISGNQQWTLVILSRDDSKLDHWIVARSWIPPGDEPLRHFDHKPSNSGVYNFLDQLRAIESRVFIFDSKRIYDWEGVTVDFIEGQVCEETWEAVIGEKPTRFFPNGK